MRRRVPVPLALLSAVAVAAALAWMVVMPPLEVSDELRHSGYVQTIAETGSVPWHPAGPPGPELYSSEMRVAQSWAGIDALRGNLAARPFWTPLDERLAHRQLIGAARDDGGLNRAMANPPLYYLYTALPYLAGSGGSFYTRLFLMRLGNVPWLLVIVVCTWLLAGHLLARRWQQTLATASVALNPQLISNVAGVNPDVMLTAFWTAALYVMVLIVRRGLSLPLVGTLAVLSAASAATHGRGIAIVAPTLLALTIALLRDRRLAGRPARAAVLGALAVAALAALVAGLHWATRGSLGVASLREFVSYVWQFYLPKLGFMEPMIGVPWTARDAFVDRYFGIFAQFDVLLARWVTTTLAWVMIAAIALAAVALARRLPQLRRGAGVVAVLAVAIGAYLWLLHISAYRLMLVEPSDPIITGRYLLPLVSLFGVMIALAVSAFPRRLAVVLGAAVISGATLLQLGSIGAAVTRFHV